MRAAVQRASRAEVTVGGTSVSRLGAPGLLVLLGVTHGDTTEGATRLARKIWELRILSDERAACDVGAPVLVVSQFTLYADLSKDRRPSWSAAAPSSVSEPLYGAFCTALRSFGADVATGVFGADMEVSLTNAGPFTLIVES